MADNRNRQNVVVGAPDTQASGAALIGEPITDETQIPENATDTIPAGVNPEAAGFVGEDGLTKTVDRETENIRDWNGDDVVVLQTSHSVTFQLQFLEAANATVLRAVHGDENVEVGTSGALTVKENAAETPHKSFIFEINGGNGRKVRVVIPDGQVTETGDTVFSKSDVVRYDVTITCFPDSQGNKAYIFFGPVADNGDQGASVDSVSAPGADEK